MWRHEEAIAVVQMRDDGDLDKALWKMEMVVSGWIQEAFKRESQQALTMN